MTQYVDLCGYLFSAPRPPRHLVVIDSGINTATLEWKEPQPLVYKVIKYTVCFGSPI